MRISGIAVPLGLASRSTQSSRRLHGPTRLRNPSCRAMWGAVGACHARNPGNDLKIRRCTLPKLIQAHVPRHRKRERMPAGSQHSRAPLPFPGRCAGLRCTLPVPPTPLPAGRSAGWKPALPAASSRDRVGAPGTGAQRIPDVATARRPRPRNIARKPVHRSPANLPACHTRTPVPRPHSMFDVRFGCGQRPH